MSVAKVVHGWIDKIDRTRTSSTRRNNRVLLAFELELLGDTFTTYARLWARCSSVCVSIDKTHSLSHSAGLARQHILVFPAVLILKSATVLDFTAKKKDEQTRRGTLQEHQFNRPGTSLSFQTLMASDGWKSFVHNYKQFATKMFSNSGATATSNWCWRMKITPTRFFIFIFRFKFLFFKVNRIWDNLNLRWYFKRILQIRRFKKQSYSDLNQISSNNHTIHHD